MQIDQLMVVALGGTIDKVYGTGGGVRELSFAQDPVVTNILRKVNAMADFTIVKLISKDSLDMTDDDRQVVFAFCGAVPHNRILITHGTDTMDKTSAVLAAGDLKKTIVLTGASQPGAMQGTDADFNIGFAMSAAMIAGPGVYVAMNARLYPWDKFKKKATTGIFEPG